MIRHFAVACLTSLAALIGTHTAGAQTYPDRPIKMVVPYTPGGQFDIHARLLAEKMSTTLGQPVVIENRPGAGTMLGAEAVARAKNDGYTLLFSGSNMFAILPHTYSKLPYTVGDFQTITTVSDLPMGLVVDAKKVPAGDIKEFIGFVRANPGKIDFGSSGTGGAQHLLGELAKMRMGLEMTQVSFRGTPRGSRRDAWRPCPSGIRWDRGLLGIGRIGFGGSGRAFTEPLEFRVRSDWPQLLGCRRSPRPDIPI